LLKFRGGNKIRGNPSFKKRIIFTKPVKRKVGGLVLKYKKIRDIVVSRVSIDMMQYFRSVEVATESFFRYKAVFKDITRQRGCRMFGFINTLISIFVKRKTFIVMSFSDIGLSPFFNSLSWLRGRNIATPGTEFSSLLYSGGENAESFTTLLANKRYEHNYPLLLGA